MKKMEAREVERVAMATERAKRGRKSRGKESKERQRCDGKAG